jgi:hypothetical protein
LKVNTRIYIYICIYSFMLFIYYLLKLYMERKGPLGMAAMGPHIGHIMSRGWAQDGLTMSHDGPMLGPC